MSRKTFDCGFIVVIASLLVFQGLAKASDQGVNVELSKKLQDVEMTTNKSLTNEIEVTTKPKVNSVIGLPENTQKQNNSVASVNKPELASGSNDTLLINGTAIVKPVETEEKKINDTPKLPAGEQTASSVNPESTTEKGSSTKPSPNPDDEGKPETTLADTTITTTTEKTASTEKDTTTDKSTTTASTPSTTTVNSMTESNNSSVSTAETTKTIETTTISTSSTPEQPENAPIIAPKPEDGMSSGIIALVMAIAFAVVVIIVYAGLLLWRRYLEYRYGNRELLVNDLEFDTNDLRHFEL